MMKEIKKLKNKPLNRLVVVFVFAVCLVIFALSVEFINNFFQSLNAYTRLPIADIISDVIYLLVCILFFLIYSRLKETIKRQKELENIIESIGPDALLVTDSDDRILRSNSSLERMFGYETDEVFQQKSDCLFDRTHSLSEDPDELANFITQTGSDSQLAFGKKKDGEIFPVEILKGNLQEQGGTVLLIRDITDRKKAEEALLKYKNELESRVQDRTAELKKLNEELQSEVNARKRIEKDLRDSQEKLKVLFEYAPIAYYLNDLNGHIIVANRAGKEMLGINGGGLANRSLKDLTRMSEREISKISGILVKNARGEPTGPDEVTFSNQNGHNVIAELCTYPVKINDQTMVLSILRDITSQKGTDEKKKKSRKS